MSEQRLTQKWAVASFFDELEPGFEFAQEDTPLHATLAGVFAINKVGDEITRILQRYLQDVEQFTVTGQAEERWGADLVVTKLADSEEFSALYAGVQDCLINSGAVFNEPEYLHDGFTPHVTKQKSSNLPIGETKKISQVSLVDMFPGNNGYRRRIHSTIILGNQDAS